MTDWPLAEIVLFSVLLTSIVLAFLVWYRD
jgi:hypothetical protein